MQSTCKSFWINLATSRCILTFYRVFTVSVFRSVVVLVVRCSLFRNPNNICKINDRLLRGSSQSRQCMKWNWCAAWETISFVMFKGAFRESVLLSIFKVLKLLSIPSTINVVCCRYTLLRILNIVNDIDCLNVL